MATTKRKTSTKGKGAKRAPAKKSDLDRRWSILLFALGLLFVVLSFVPGDKGWAWMRQNILFGAFGISGWLLGPVLIYWAVLVSMEKPVFPAVIKCSLFMIALSGAALVFGQVDFEGLKFGQGLAALLDSGKTMYGGGLLSAVFGLLLMALFGRLAARILLVLLVLVAVMVLTGVTPADVARFFYGIGDKLAGLFVKDGDEEDYAEPPVEKPAARGSAGGGRKRDLPPAQQTARQPRRMAAVDVPLDMASSGAVPPVAKTNNKGWATVDIPLDAAYDGVPPTGKTNNRGWASVDIDLGADEPQRVPGRAEHVQADIGRGGSFGVKDAKPADSGETGLGDDYVPIVPFNPYAPELLPDGGKKSPSVLLFGKDDPYSALGGADSRLDHTALPVDVEHIDLHGAVPEDDPDFELFRAQEGAGIAPLPDMEALPPAEDPAPEYADPMERAVRTAAEESFERLSQPAPEEQLPFEMESQVPVQQAPPEAVAVAEAHDDGQEPTASQDPEVAAMIQHAAAKKDDETSGRPVVVQRAYQGPPLSCFSMPPVGNDAGAQEEMRQTADRLVGALASFGVQTKIINISRGPSVTRYEVQPQQGVKISRITALADDIALNLAAHSVRIEAPIPGKPAVGIEVPNEKKATVSIRGLLESKRFTEEKSPLAIALGKDIAGEVVVADLTRMPHLLIAGSTGSGKSVCVNSIIMSFLYKSSPEDVRLLLIDPKIVELAEYNGIPHLLIPVVNEPKQAAKALGYAVSEMERRYHLFAEHNVRDIASFNKLAAGSDEVEKIPHIAIVIDELADLMMVAGKDVETFICRIAQKARAAGMHLIVATQRPSVDVITGLIKSNIPSRIAFAVASQVDSRTILDGAGAEKLLGMGDMLFMPVGANKPVRVQGTYVTDGEISNVLDFLKQNTVADYDEDVLAEMEKVVLTGAGKGAAAAGTSAEEDDDGGNLLADPTFVNAVETALEGGQISTSFLQRRLRLGYARAGRIMDQMERMGIISQPEGSKPRQVLITRQQWQEMVMNAGE